MIASARLISAGVMLALAGSSRIEAGEPSIESIAVYPPQVRLDDAADAQALLVIATTSDGHTLDVTADASFAAAAGDLVTIDGSRMRPKADGTAQISVSWNGRSSAVPITVAGAARARPISFRRDVLPVFMVSGCNSGACHGSARGQDGFHLSLFGFDPAGDYHQLTRDLPGRRLDTAFPASSLLLEKPTASVPHTGGRRFEPGSADYAALSRWIAAGAPPDPAEVPFVSRIELFPPEGVLAGSGRTLRLSVLAHYSDGTDRDVTDLAVFRSSNAASARVSRGGLLASGQGGEAFVTASFAVHTVGAPFVVLASAEPFTFADPAAGAGPAGTIDELVNARLRKLRMLPSPLCSDAEYLRRASLDLVGLLPTVEERAAFLADSQPGKREQLVDRLLSRREFVELWLMQWAEILQIRSNDRISEKAALLYFEWVRNSIMGGVPADEMVRRILSAQGGTFTSPATNFYENQADALVLAENVAQAFMGIRIQCAQCHNHPFDRWTQDDYYGFAAFFAQLGRKPGADPRETIVFDRRAGEVAHPVGGRTMAPKFLGGPQPDVGGRDRRAALAEWLTAPDNPYFARSLANRLWAHLMGVGIIEPVDDFQVSNPPSNGPLLDALAARLVASGYDVKPLVREILASRAYQRSTARNDTNRQDERNFAHALVRRLRAETLLDILCQVTEMPEKFGGLPLGARAVEIADGTTSTYFLSTFGRARRDSVCACEVSREPSLSQTLHLLNGETVDRKIREGAVIRRMLEGGKAPEQIVSHLYVRALGREPSGAEMDAAREALAPGGTPVAAVLPVLEDVSWAVLNSPEFVFNH